MNIEKSFEGWEAWKEANKNGIDCTVIVQRKGNTITTSTENLGITIYNVTTIPDPEETVYVMLTGDQCAITNIRYDE